MWLKEENNKLIPPPVNYRTPTGWIMNFYKNIKAMIRYGWRNWTKEEYDAWKEAHPDPVIPRTTCTKYELVTCLQNHFPELLQSLMDTYAVTPNLQFYWNSVLDLDRNNADFQNLANSLGITSAQLDAIFAKIGA
jgi:hypothetical protein